MKYVHGCSLNLPSLEAGTGGMDRVGGEGRYRGTWYVFYCWMAAGCVALFDLND